jgi:hypothetical protein
VDIGGTYVIPGLFDFHMHVTEPFIQNEMQLYAGFGVTGVRDLGSDTTKTLDIISQINGGQKCGPTIYSYGRLVDGSQPRWPDISITPESIDSIANHIQYCKKSNLTGVKFYHKLSLNFLKHGLKFCQINGLRSSGHLGDKVKVSDAIQLGIDSIEHVVTLSRDLVPGGRLIEADGFWHYFGPFKAWHEDVDLDSALTDRLISQLISSGTVFVPTLSVYESIARASDPSVTADPHLELIETQALREWEEARQQLGFKEEHFTIAARAFEKMKIFVRRVAEAGGEVGVGTDAPNPYIIPGASIHRELKLLDEAGIERPYILRQACHSPAKWLGESNSWGTLKEGLKANFVVLEGNPLKDIGATRSIRMTVMNGKEIPPVK